MVRPTINSDKHYVHHAVSNVASGARTNINLITVDNQLAAVTDVRVGAIVKAIYVEMWIDGDTSSNTVQGVVYKRPSGVAALTTTNFSNMTAYGNKKNVLEYHQGLNPASGNMVALFRHWIKIPKGKQRFGIGDILSLAINSIGTEIHMCGFAVFKEYY